MCTPPLILEKAFFLGSLLGFEGSAEEMALCVVGL